VFLVFYDLTRDVRTVALLAVVYKRGSTLWLNRRLTTNKLTGSIPSLSALTELENV
jgi:hypothetical protein